MLNLDSHHGPRPAYGMSADPRGLPSSFVPRVAAFGDAESRAQQTHERLKDLGVVFKRVPHLVARMPDHDLWMAFLHDPDENVLGMMSEVPRG